MKVTITGGSGFLGEKLIERLKDNEITIVARNEGETVKIKEKFPDIKIVTGDIADEWITEKAIKGADEVYHLAASKSVELAEVNTYQCISSNVLGSIQVLRAAQKHRPKVVIGISTDKAAQVAGVYGATKLLMEKLFSEAEKANPDTKYRIVRYGNVIGSTGSFITKWKPKMERGEEVELTDPEMTRFFWTRDQAIDHIFDCIDMSHDATPYIPKMKAISMGDILEACQEVYGKCPVKIIGNRGGENLHESMGEKDENGDLIFSNHVEKYTKKEFIELFLTK